MQKSMWKKCGKVCGKVFGGSLAGVATRPSILATLITDFDQILPTLVPDRFPETNLIVYHKKYDLSSLF